jgi:hypothetical protein
MIGVPYPMLMVLIFAPLLVMIKRSPALIGFE